MNLKEEYMDSGFVWQPSGNFACPLDNFQSVLSPSWVQNAFQLNLTSVKDHRYPALINCVARKQTSRIYRFEILSCCKESDFLLIRKLASNNGNVNITLSFSNKERVYFGIAGAWNIFKIYSQNSFFCYGTKIYKNLMIKVLSAWRKYWYNRP